MREAEILGLFSHPHIVHLRYFTRTSTTWLLYFEHAGFTTLSQYIEQHGKFSRPAPLNTQSWGAWDVSNEHTTRRFARQIGSALRYCHFHCVHHLNLHSDKIVINNKGNIKLTGFGSLQLVSANDDENFDTFSYGTILWHMACGTVPWPVHENFDRYLRNLSSVVSNSGIFTSGIIPSVFPCNFREYILTCL
jgi:serine/threonine protein kinase